MLYMPQKFSLFLDLSLYLFISLFRHREGGEEAMGVHMRGCRCVKG
jgi:hypothetical protein